MLPPALSPVYIAAVVHSKLTTGSPEQCGIARTADSSQTSLFALLKMSCTASVLCSLWCLSFSPSSICCSCPLLPRGPSLFRETYAGGHRSLRCASWLHVQPFRDTLPQDLWHFEIRVHTLHSPLGAQLSNG